MSYQRPAWAGGQEVPQQMPQFKNVNIDVGQFIRTRDALTSAYLNLSSNIDRAVKAYLDHTQVVLNGDATLNANTLLHPFNVLTQQAQMARMALQQHNGGASGMPMMVPNGGAIAEGVKSEEPMEGGKKKRKKRAYKPRDPNAPKRPLTAYFRYLGEARPTIQAEINTNPELHKTTGKPGDISRIATDRWNALTAEQQQPYKEAYQAELKDYEKAIAAYKAMGGQVDETTMMTLDGAEAEAAATPAAVMAPAAEKAAEEEEDDDDDDTTSDDDDEEEEEVAPPPPPQPPKATPKKSALKKGGKASAVQPAPAPAVSTATPIFSSINNEAAAGVPNTSSDPAKSSSPTRKRKGADATVAEGESGRKKRTRKSNAAEEVVAGADEAPAPAPVAPMASSPDVADTTGKKKKDKKKRRGNA